MEFPPVTLVMTVYIPPIEGGFGRLQCAKQTVASWARNLHYPGELRLHIADDTVVGFEATEVIAEFCPWPVTITHTKGAGLGGALNAGVLKATEVSPFFIYADDSYSLRDPLDLSPWIGILQQDESVGAISLMPPRPEQHGGRVREYGGGLQVETIRTIEFERHGYTWNGRPFLYHRRFIEHYGAFPENCTGYEWEQIYAERYVQMSEGPCVLFAFHDPWLHVWTVRLGDKPAGWNGR